MKKTDIAAAGLTTVRAQRLFRQKHRQCIAANSEFICHFEDGELLALCKPCLIDKSRDLGPVI